MDLFRSTKLDVPETDSFVVLLVDILICGKIGATPGPGRTMLRHFSDTTMPTPSWIYFNTFDVLPKRVSIQRGFNGAISGNDAHIFYCHLILQENFECLVHNSILQSFHITLILLCKDGLWNQEICQLVWKNVNLEFYLVCSCLVLQILRICRVNYG